MPSSLCNEQLVLRAVEPEDLDFMYRIENDSQLGEISNPHTPYSKYALKEYIKTCRNDIFIDRQLRLMIEIQKEKKEVIGIIDLFDFDPFHNRAEVGIMIESTYRKKGFATRALKLLCDYSFQTLHLNQLYAYIPCDNLFSIRLFTRTGFVPGGTLKEWIHIRNAYKDVFLMQCLRP